MRFKLISLVMLTLFLVSMLSAVTPVSAAGGWIPEDVVEDGVINILDVNAVIWVFGSSVNQPNLEGVPYDPAADVNNDNVIDIFDLVSVAVHFGETDP